MSKTLLRDPNKAHSIFTLWVNQHCDHVMHFPDIDAVSYVLGARTLRIIEWKMPGEKLTESQQAVLPLFAMMIDAAVILRFLGQGSGVFVVECRPPDFEEGIYIQRWGHDKRQITVEALKRLVTGKRS